MPQEKINLRECNREDAESIASFYNKFNYGTISSGYLLKTSDIEGLLDERGITSYLLMEYEGKIIATMLFSNLSGQKMAEPNAVWAGSFLIHPEFRNGSLPGKFFAEAIPLLIEKGYWFIDTEVDPSNVAAMALYKRVGMYQTSRSTIDYDGYLDLRSYLPYVIQFLLNGFASYISKQSGLLRGWRDLIAPNTFRSDQLDSEVVNGVELVMYKLNFNEGEVICWVDIFSQKVSKMEDTRFHFNSYVKEGQKLFVGQTINICFEFLNCMENRVLVKFHTKLGEKKVEYKNGKSSCLLDPGELYKWEETVICSQAFSGTLVTSVRFGKVYFDFQYGVKISPKLEMDIISSVHSEQVDNLNYIRIINNSSELICGELQFDVINTNLLRINDEKKRKLTVYTGEIVDIPLNWNSLNPGVAVINGKFISTTGELICENFFNIPIHAPGQKIRYERDSFAILENQYLSVKVNIHTGALFVYDQYSGEQVVQEAWPDLGWPYISGVKRMINRQLSIILERNDTILLVEYKNNQRILARRITIISDNSVQIEDFLNSEGKLKIHPWCMLRDAVISIPFIGETLQSTVVYEDFPFSIHDFEYSRNMELPANPNEYSMTWTAFENKDVTVGMFWKGDVEELLYGLRWMPSIVFAKSKRPLTKKNTLAKVGSVFQLFDKNKFWENKVPNAVHYFFVGKGGTQEVERSWQLQFGKKGPLQVIGKRVRICTKYSSIITNGKIFTLHGSLSTLLVKEISGILTLSIPKLNFNQSIPISGLNSKSFQEWKYDIFISGEFDVIHGELCFQNEKKGLIVEKSIVFLIVSPDEKVFTEEKIDSQKSTYTLQNNVLKLKIAPEFQGSLISLKYKGKETLQSFFPKLGTIGQNIKIPGGIFPQQINYSIDLENGILFRANQMESYESHPISLPSSNGQNWEGIRCTGTETSIEYLILPGIPLIRVNIYAYNNTRMNRLFHTAIQFFWKMGSSKNNPKTIFYWNKYGKQVIQESGSRRKVYGDAQLILKLDEQLFVGIWLPSSKAKLAIYEWPDKGFQIVMLYPFEIISETKTNITLFTIIGNSFEEVYEYFQIEVSL